MLQRKTQKLDDGKSRSAKENSGDLVLFRDSLSPRVIWSKPLDYLLYCCRFIRVQTICKLPVLIRNKEVLKSQEIYWALSRWSVVPSGQDP